VEQVFEAACYDPDAGDGVRQFDDEGVEMKWRYFLVAALVVGYAMLAVGAPFIAVAAGIAFAAFLNLKQLKGLNSEPSKKSQTPVTPATRTVNP
jgi:hypothetical protein